MRFLFMDERVRSSIDRMNEYCRRIAFTMHRFGNDFDSFNKDYDYQSSVLFNLQQIGENAKLIRLWLSENSTYDWNPVCSFRDFIAHNYARVENKVIWKILTDDFPLMMNGAIRLKSLWIVNSARWGIFYFRRENVVFSAGSRVFFPGFHDGRHSIRWDMLRTR